MNFLKMLKSRLGKKTLRPTPAPSSTSQGQTTVRYLNNHNILKFLDDLERYTVRDLKELTRVARTNEWLDKFRKRKGEGRCATAAASLCFAVIEQVGLILRNDLVDPANPADLTLARTALKKGNSRNAESFFAYAQSKGIQTINNSYLQAIYILFRNKITHNLFPAHGLGVSQDSRNNLTDLVISINGANSLSINALVDCIVRVILNLRKDVNDSGNYYLVLSLNDTLTRLSDAEITNLRNKYADPDTIRKYPALQTELHRLLPGFRF
ncbi:hypothetical protein [Chitinophaga pinensis]|uniref:Uncharacterized protein n=1 Tax=Chitinophaga pinensis (strain ATCC 43595 / DSM 2588 / LMG 13176 / NBRC 15968 / NCIMB 11800 / UQM 2034) TaxID=485918 RepID=A0A979GWM8_CHIPD|nr:hypothetical protein [Chitinophaga pinensis]ACU60620.1 hypothetical protein Cpin_3153 [Chitinophaga pinensis DSM 2588]